MAETGEAESGTRGEERQFMHLVFGGELTHLDEICFRDLDSVDLVGIFPDRESAHSAWKAKAQATVDNAHMRYFIAPLHKVLNPDS